MPSRKETCFGLAVLAAFLTGCASAPLNTPAQRRDFAKVVIANWYTYSEVSAMKLMDEYGPPDQIESSRLIWNNRDPWKRIAVWDVVPDYDSNLGPDNLEEAVDYPVAPAQRKALAAFDSHIWVSKDGSEVAGRYATEELNFLALNLAHDVLAGLKDPAQARSFSDRTLALSAEGKSSSYMKGLNFTPER
jgi:hypothetical protein